MEKEKIFLEIIKEIQKRKPKTKEELSKIKLSFSKKYKIPFPKDTEIFSFYEKLKKEKKIKEDKNLEKILVKKKIRSLSGIVSITCLTKPFPCPGKCIFCPQAQNFPKSYLPGEPAAERAKKLSYDPFLQMKERIKSLEIQGHPTEKIELIILGGCFNFYPKEYQEWFIKRCFDAANEKESKNLEEAKKINETAKKRIVGISVETRPDLISEKEIIFFRYLGITKVEIGVQIPDDEILKLNQRGHTKKEIIFATKLLKDAGFKVQYHLMPNLFGSSFENDIKRFKEIFENENYRPDWIKLYPCVVLEKTKLFKLWKEGKYKPYDDKKLIELLIEIKKTLPYYVRVARLFRDIPANQIVAGCKISNLREVIKKEMEKRKIKCKCIRCREVRERYNPKDKFYLFREDYFASGGKEIFLSYETKNREKLFSFLRLRVPSTFFEKKKHFIKVLDGAGIVRELHTYGKSLPLKMRNSLSPQHKGLGKKLLLLAEKILKKEFGLKKIAVISGVGVREYYRKLGYTLQGEYMIKKLS